MNELLETALLSKGDAEQQIRALLQEVALLGANDTEFGDFDTILAGLNSGQLTPVEALEKAYHIKSSKMEYR